MNRRTYITGYNQQGLYKSADFAGFWKTESATKKARAMHLVGCVKIKRVNHDYNKPYLTTRETEYIEL